MYTEGRTHLGSTVRGNVVAASHHNQAHDGNQHHDADTQSTIPQVEHLGNRHDTSSTHDTGNNGDDSEQRVLRKVTSDICGKVRGQAAVQSIDEVQKPHAIHYSAVARKEHEPSHSRGISDNQRFLRPRSSNCFSDANTILLILIILDRLLRRIGIHGDRILTDPGSGGRLVSGHFGREKHSDMPKAPISSVVGERFKN